MTDAQPDAVERVLEEIEEFLTYGTEDFPEARAILTRFATEVRRAALEEAATMLERRESWVGAEYGGAADKVRELAGE